MSGYETRIVEVAIGQSLFNLKTLKDRNQYYDPQKLAERAGIPKAYWSLFGQLWPASQALAKVVKQLKLTGKKKRILELGCGLALPSLVLKKKGADITATDRHPLVKQFLEANCALNQLEKIRFKHLNWEALPDTLGKFDVIIASDVLYVEEQSKLLARTIQQLAQPQAKVLITCPGRGFRNQFSKRMQAQGFSYHFKAIPFVKDEQAPYKGRLLTFTR